MGYVSVRASACFLRAARVNYQMEQHTLAVCAKQRGNLTKAAHHYANLVSASSVLGMSFWRKTQAAWTMVYPWTCLVLEKMENAVDSRRAENLQESVNRALLADALEQAGRGEEAMQEYAKAARLQGHEDIARIRALVSSLASTENELLKLQDQYIDSMCGQSPD